MEERKNLGQEIKVARVRANLSQDELAKKSGVCRTTIVHIENNDVVATKETLIKLADALRVDPIKWF